MDLSRSIDSQEPFTVFLHKLTDIIASANQGDITVISTILPSLFCTFITSLFIFQSCNIIKDVEKYISSRPDLIVIDPIPKVRQLLDRYKCYSIIQSTSLRNYGVFTPNFCEITTNDYEKTIKQLKNAKVTYPLICKPQLGHGSKKAHEMIIVFNETGLKDCKAPCVAQSLINHNAVLYKIFIVGDAHFFVERPSLKNFYYNVEAKSIFFDSSDVSKAGSQSKLSVLDPEDENVPKVKPNPEILERIASTLRKAFGMELLGVDVVIENNTKKYAIIDVNAYPGSVYFVVLFNFYYILSLWNNFDKKLLTF